MRWPHAGAIGTPVIETQATPSPTASPPEPSAPEGSTASPDINFSDPESTADPTSEPLVSGDVPTAEPETNEDMEEPAKDGAEESFSPKYTANFDPLVDYAEGADPTVQYMLWAIHSALSSVTNRLEQGDLAIISLRKTITNQSSAIATLTAEVRKARNAITPSPPPAKNTRPPPQKNTNSNPEKAKNNGKQSYADAAKNASDAGFTKVTKKIKPGPLFKPE